MDIPVKRGTLKRVLLQQEKISAAHYRIYINAPEDGRTDGLRTKTERNNPFDQRSSGLKMNVKVDVH